VANLARHHQLAPGVTSPDPVQSITTMECLTPIKSREPITQALAVSKVTWCIIAVGLGVAIGGAAVVDWHTVISTLGRHPLFEAELAIFAGAVPGFMLSRRKPVRRSRTRSLDRYYRTLVTADPPPAAGYTHYLPCTLLGRGPIDASLPVPAAAVRQNPSMSGILYAGPDGICFRPNSALHPSPSPAPTPSQSSAGPSLAGSGIALVEGNGHSSDLPVGFEIGPVRMVTATAVAIAPGGLSQDATEAPEFAMLMEWPGGQALFAVPAIGDTLPRLHDCLDTLRWGTAS
jgi:hypothetical protein